VLTAVQCSPKGTFPGGAWQCFTQTISKEVSCRRRVEDALRLTLRDHGRCTRVHRFRLYRGVSPILFSWEGEWWPEENGFDHDAYASLHNYRAFLKSAGLSERIPGSHELGAEGTRLSMPGHWVAGVMAGWTK